ncbi:MAG TPA: amino acid permease [Polyangia bacterium]|jgi:APA family basic amino acid/polyamine antiporter|nr:amino acid permease [Polyangia bacterium]
MTAQRPLGAMHAAALVVASMVGTGIFTTTGVLLTSLPSPAVVLIGWVLSGLLALCGAAVYAELGAMMPRAGGEYVYVSRAFGPAVGFMSGWVALIVGFAAPTAGGALGFASYVHGLVPALPTLGVEITLIAVLTAVHMFDVRFGARLQIALAGLVVAVIVVFVGAALATGRLTFAHLAAGASSPGGSGPARGLVATAGAFAVGLVQISYAYSGWNGAAYVAGEVRDPARSLPRALGIGTGLVTLLYLLLNVVFLCAVPPATLAGQVNVAHIAAGALFGAGGAQIVSSLVALTAAGFVSAMLMSGPRVAVAMAEDGVFFRALGRRNARGAPSLAVALQGALAIVAVATARFDQILVYVGFALTLNGGAAVLAAFVLRRRDPAGERPHRALGWPYSGVLFLALAAFMTVLAVRERPRESAAALATLVAGGVAYAAWHRRRRRT